MKLAKSASLLLALTFTVPSVEVQAGSKSSNDPAVGALLAAFMREKHCGKKMPSDAMVELIADAYPTDGDPLRVGDFAKDFKRRAEVAYKSMPKSSRQRTILCPHLEEIMAKWLVDKVKHPERYQ